MYRMMMVITMIIITMMTNNTFAASRYGGKICKNDSRFYCYQVKSGDSWEKLFPNYREMDVVKRLNRMNLHLRTGMTIAVPYNLPNTTIFDISPFPLHTRATGENRIVVDLDKLAWAAYDADGNLIIWGPASGGRGYCSDAKKVCKTISGNYEIQSKEYASCVSNTFPLSYDGGAPMPFCMHVYAGFALHGSYDVPGYNDSHGCIRMFINDARWLNENFADVGTKVTIKKYKIK